VYVCKFTHRFLRQKKCKAEEGLVFSRRLRTAGGGSLLGDCIDQMSMLSVCAMYFPKISRRIKTSLESCEIFEKLGMEGENRSRQSESSFTRAPKNDQKRTGSLES